MWWIVLALCIGVLIGAITVHTIYLGRRAGTLYCNIYDPDAEQIFELELHKTINDVYKKRFIVLEVSQK